MEKHELPRLTPVEFKLMEIVWTFGHVTVTEVLNTYNEKARKDKQVTRSTMHMQIARLTEKGWLKHRRKKNTFYYSATRNSHNVKGEMIQDVNNRIFGGSCTKLVSALFEHSELSKTDISELRELLNSKEKSE